MKKNTNIKVIKTNILGKEVEISYISDEIFSIKRVTDNGTVQIFSKEKNIWIISDGNSNRLGYIAENNIYKVINNEIIKIYTMNEDEYTEFKFINFSLEMEILNNEIKKKEEEMDFLKRNIQEQKEKLEKNILTDNELMEIINRGDTTSLHSIKLYLKYLSKINNEKFNQNKINAVFNKARKCDIKKSKKLINRLMED